jgi:acetolactate synthase I/II/III large subunit
MMKYTVRKSCWNAWCGRGEVVFGYPGGANLPIYDAMLSSPHPSRAGRHEQGLTHMADGYARASGGLAWRWHSGPGATNMVTGIATAMMDSSPMVCITGQVASTDRLRRLPGNRHHRHHPADHQAQLPGHRRATILPHRARGLLHRPHRRPGPVLIDICQRCPAGEHRMDLRPIPHPPARLPPDLRPMRRKPTCSAVDTDQKRQTPGHPGGRGVMMSGAMEQFCAFRRKDPDPGGDDPAGLGGFPASHPLSLGMMGMHGEAWTNRAIQKADLLLAFGMRFDDRVTGTLKDLCAQRAQDPHRYRPLRNSTRTSKSMCRWSATCATRGDRSDPDGG